jgi:hypothetical protein
MQEEFVNVGEHWPLVDTVIIGTDSNGEQKVPGWMNTLATLGQANHLYFFNSRSRADGLAYCNTDTRDKMPYAFKLYSLGVRFFATMQTEGPDPDATADWWTSNYVPHIFMVDLPRHCSCTLQVQQDDVLKTTVPLVPAGYGPVGGAYGRGSPNSAFSMAVDKSYSAITQSTAHITNRWSFPTEIQIPRTASFSIDLRFTEYARQLLQAMTKYNTQDAVSGNGHAENLGHQSKTYYGIQVTLIGERLVQQRGELHR